MRELTPSEIEATNGAGFLGEPIDSLFLVKRLSAFYDVAITSTADLMCNTTGNC